MYLNTNTGNTYNSGGNLYVSSGSVVQPTLSFVQPTLTVSAGTYRTFKNSTNFSDEIVQFSLPQQQFTLADNTKYYLCVKYNNGSPIMFLETDITQTNDSNILVIYTLFTEGNELDSLNWNTEGIGLVNKLNERFIDTTRFGIVTPFSFTADNSTIITTGGKFYLGSNKISLDSFTSLTDSCELLIRNGSGGWTSSHITNYDNTKYDNNSGTLATLVDGNYGVIWIWRSAGTPKEVYAVMGQASYVSLQTAQSAKIPSNLPEKVQLGSILLGRAIFLKGSATALVESSFDTVFNASAPTQHNGLLGIQGSGVAGEYNHLSNAQYVVVQNTSNTNTGDETQATIKTKLGVANTSQDGYLTSTDWDTFNDKEPALAKGNLTAGSNKVSIGGNGTNAVIGAGVSVDVNPSNILHNDLSTKQGGTTGEFFHLTQAQVNSLIKITSVLTNHSEAIAYQTTPATHTFNQTTNYQKLVVQMTAENLTGGFTIDTINNRLSYTGTTKKFYFNATSTLLNCTTNNTTISFRVYKNANIAFIQTTSTVKLDSATSKSTINAASGFTLNNGDYIEIFGLVDKNCSFDTNNMQLQIAEDLGDSYLA